MKTALLAIVGASLLTFAVPSFAFAGINNFRPDRPRHTMMRSHHARMSHDRRSSSETRGAVAMHRQD